MALSIPVTEIVKNSHNPLLKISPSWTRVTLNDIAKVTNGFAFPSSNFSNSEGVPLLRIRDIGSNKTECHYKGDFDPEFIVEPGDLIVGMDGDFNCDIWKGKKALLNQRVCKINVTSTYYDPKFLYYVLPGYLNAINEKTSSVTVKHISSKSINEIPLPLPPYNEQKRIVEKIEELFTKMDASVEELKKLKAQMSIYRQSILKYAMEGKLTEMWREKNYNELDFPISLTNEIINTARNPQNLPKKWILTELIHCTNLITKGESPGWQGYNYVNDGILFIRSENVLWGNMNVKSAVRIPERFHNKLSRSQIKPGDVLINLVGASIGRCCIVPKTISEANINQAVSLIRPKDFLVPQFLMYLLISPQFQKTIHGQKVETARPNISLKDLRTLKIFLPPINEQYKIVEKIERHYSMIKETENDVDQNLIRSEHLKQSILKRAFEGKLVPQDPSDESAEVLLKRIKSENSTLDTFS